MLKIDPTASQGAFDLEEKYCDFCDKRIINRRADAKYCSDSCKTRDCQRRKSEPKTNPVSGKAEIHQRILDRVRQDGYVIPALLLRAEPNEWPTQLDRRFRELYPEFLDRRKCGQYSQYFIREEGRVNQEKRDPLSG